MEKALLVGIYFNKREEENIKENLKELFLLAKTLNCQICGEIIQRREAPDPKTYIGRGKGEEISKIVRELDIKTVIFEGDLSPSQVKNLEDMFGCKVIDRTWLILSLFAQKAKTEEAKVQVSLAQYEYLLPRLTKQWTHLSRQWGGIGTKGVGEKQLELDKRAIKNRIDHLKSCLKNIERKRDITFKSHKNFPRVALVGYTNAGKSTLFNLITKSKNFVSPMPFSTLDPKVARISSGKIPILFSDTVGFLRNLPHHLIASFKSTLMEAIYADIVLHIIDRSHPNFEEQARIGLETLENLKVPKEKIINLYNKADLIFSNENVPFPYISATKGWGLENLFEIIEKNITGKFLIIKRKFPLTEKENLNVFLRNNCVVSLKNMNGFYEVDVWVRKNPYTS